MTSLRLLSLGAALCALAACASNPLPSGGKLAASDVGVMASATSTTGMDPIARAAFWGTRYDEAPNDTQTAVAFSQALRALDNHDEALRVMGQAAQLAPRDAGVQLEYGKVLIANERPH